jgi:tetratricopeptide (TPR) repeat protein
MKIRKFATITLLVLSSFAASSVAPSKTELESMYDKAFREFDSGNYEQALKDLDAIDARQPDLAESQNLRGVIHMRQKEYDKAEAALRKALAADPKFWNARFNLAEVPFLQKNWAEARKRFQELLAGNAAELQGEATQLIQYKILITHLVEGKENMVDAMLAKFELTPDTPAAHYANAALALQKKDEPEAKDWLTKAEKNFSPQLNKLFAESLYSVGWLEKPAGQSRAAIELNSQADRAAKTKAFAQAKFEEAEQALQQRDLTAARKLIDEADSATPNQAPILNLRGEILMEQKDFAAAENEFRKATKADPKFRDAQYNLALVPFKEKDYTKARDRFEALFASTTGADKDQAAQLIKFQIFLTLLLEGKDSRAQKMMEQFQFTGDTPALYYAQAAWEFKNNNTNKANDWVTSARKIYSPALNGVFSDSFYDLGWLQTPAMAASPGPMVADAGPVIDASPGIEPTPLPNLSLALNDAAKGNDPLTQAAALANSAVPGMEATTSNAEQTPAASTAVANAPAASPSVETPVASTASPAAARPVVASAPENDDANAVPTTTAAQATASPATVLAPAKVREWSQPTFGERVAAFADGNTMFIVLSAAGVFIIAWVTLPMLMRRRSGSAPVRRAAAPATTPEFDEDEAVGAVQQLVAPTRLAGGPPQVSLQLRASEPALRRAVMPLGKTAARAHGNGYTNGNGHGHGNGHGSALVGAAVAAPVESFVKPEPVVTAEPEPFYEGVGEPQPNETVAYAPTPSFEPPFSAEPPRVDEPASFTAMPADGEPTAPAEPMSFVEPVSVDVSPAADVEPQPAPTSFVTTEAPAAEMVHTPETTFAPEAPVEPEMSAPIETPAETIETAPQMIEASTEPAEPIADFAPESAFVAPEPSIEPAPVEFVPAVAANISAPVEEAPIEETMPIAAEAAAVQEIAAEAPAASEFQVEAATVQQDVVEAPAFAAPAFTTPEPTMSAPETAELEAEPIGQGAPVPYQTANDAPESAAAEPVVETPKPQPAAPRESSGGFFRTALAGIGALRQRGENRVPAPAVVTPEPAPQQPTTPAPAIMATPTPPAPAIRTSPATPMTGAAPQQAGGMQQPGAGMQPAATHQPAGGGMHTAVQLTFSFEIASLQLTPSFKMGALQLRPTSRIVTMRLAPSQQPQPAMNLQVTFEIGSVQLAGGSIGMVRLTPSQQQPPTMITSPAFNIAGLQLVSGAQAAPVQLTPSQQGQASVLVTGGFQIATVEFSPAFEIASIVLNATGKNVSVQLPGAGPSAIEGAPVFEIGSVQLAGNGEIGMMQLNPRGGAAPQQGGAPRPNA